MQNNDIDIRAIQHYLYCPHRWGLIEIGCSWEENVFVTKGNLMHKRVHDPDKSFISRDKTVLMSVPVFNDKLGLFGIVDCLELIKNNDGVELPGYEEKYEINIVEYKPTKPKSELVHFQDLMQVYAQKLCVDFSFNTNSVAYIYYGNTKKRYKVEFPISCNTILMDTMEKIRINRTAGIIPPINKKQHCNGCSMIDICMPKTSKKNKSTKQIVMIDEGDDVCENY